MAPRTVPISHNTDHRAVVARFCGGNLAELADYRKQRQRFLLRLPKVGPQGELETAFEELLATVETPPPRERPTNSWILLQTWALIDHRAGLRKGGRLSGKKCELLT